MSRAPLAALLALVAACPALAAQRALRLDPAATTVYFRVDARAHHVLGTMPLVAAEVRFDPDTGAAAGAIAMDPGRADTGIGRRDRTMREEVFEVARYPEIVFRPHRVVGAVPAEGAGELRLEGTLAIHGGEHPLSLPVRVQVDGAALRATTTFEIPYVAWGMKNPGNSLLKVADVVEVRVEASGVLGEPAP